MTYKMAKGVKITLTEKQENWLKKHFLHTKNAEIAQKLGISETAVHRFARALGLKKSRQYMVKCQRETADAARIVYYTEATKRGKKIEAKRQPWYKFMPLDPVNDTGQR